ncbi:chymotrypsin-2 [Bombyx mori]|uniref:Peptidase S1 domain-containing protein n=1 Tax=Bombyx mori TaxID=7091 RepID=A0A8R2HMN3_BOMMO|nr:chymotrypsin-2 [Bombyx mori]
MICQIIYKWCFEYLMNSLIRATGEMNIKYGILFVALFAAAWALPKPEDDMSIFYEHVDRNARIVGGSQAAQGSHPHMVAMTNGIFIRSFVCGGSVLTARSVLTAAHCIVAVFTLGSLSGNLRLTVGTNQWNSGGSLHTVSRNITHPHYVSNTIKNDLGILITSSNIVFNNRVRPISLSFDYVPGGVPVRVAGWGRVRANGALSTNLLEINVRTIDGQTCVRTAAQAAIDLNVRAPPVEPHIELCTFHAEGTGTCNGDSGSALARTDSGLQVGIVSWGFPCARGAPDMFVRVSAFRSWLQQNIS